ncbi:hypothetical protein CU098_004885, partial [Rhizopus stolonifer]
LESIKHEIDRRDDEKLKSCSYNANGCHTGVVGGKTIELSLLEVAGVFGFSDISRSTKDHIKGSFGTLALLQEIELYERSTVDPFTKKKRAKTLTFNVQSKPSSTQNDSSRAN